MFFKIQKQKNTGLRVTLFFMVVLISGLSSAQTTSISKVVATIHGDPRYQMGFNWVTTGSSGSAEAVQVVEGACGDDACFEGAASFDARAATFNISRSVGLVTGSAPQAYRTRKAEAAGLTPGTAYSYRVGSPSGWSDVGTFTTAPDGAPGFSFLYTTDPQDNMVNAGLIANAALKRFQDEGKHPSFWVVTGDHTDWNTNIEWNDYFTHQQNAFYKIPYAPVSGNHEVWGSNYALSGFFNTEPLQTPHPVTRHPGSVYSFVYGDVLFLSLNYESLNTEITNFPVPQAPAYFDSVGVWMEAEIARHKNERGEFGWIIACSHKGVFTGGALYHTKDEANAIRNNMAPIYNRLGIDIGLHGHNHVYEVIGPVGENQKLVDAAYITGRDSVPTAESTTGYKRGVYDVSEGAIFFSNGAAGNVFYPPIAQDSNVYLQLFTGGFIDIGRPTYSIIDITRDTVTITTYVLNTGADVFYDAIKITKKSPRQTAVKFSGGPISNAKHDVSSLITVRAKTLRVNESPETAVRVRVVNLNGRTVASFNTKGGASLSLQKIPAGVYIVEARRIHDGMKTSSNIILR